MASVSGADEEPLPVEDDPVVEAAARTAAVAPKEAAAPGDVGIPALTIGVAPLAADAKPFSDAVGCIAVDDVSEL